MRNGGEGHWGTVVASTNSVMLHRYAIVTKLRVWCPYISIQPIARMAHIPHTTCFVQRFLTMTLGAFAVICLGALVGCDSTPNERAIASTNIPVSSAQSPALIAEAFPIDNFVRPPSELEVSLTQYLSSLVGAWDVYLPDLQRSGGTAIFLKDVRDGQPIFRLLSLPETSRNLASEVVFYVANERIWREARGNWSSEVGSISVSEPGCSIDAGRLFFQSVFIERTMGGVHALICMRVEYSQDSSHGFVELWRHSPPCGNDYRFKKKTTGTLGV